MIESVTGASTIACGLNTAQNYLREIKVLEYSQSQLCTKLKRLKRLKENNPASQSFINYIYHQDKYKNIPEVEKLIGYEFKNKLWLVEALTHKSYIDQNQAKQDHFHYINAQSKVSDPTDKSLDASSGEIEEIPGVKPEESEGAEANKDQEEDIDPFDDYERLEFLGDCILNFLIAEYFYKSTVNDKEKKMPKELHKMKTSVINNALLSLIVIENGIHKYVLYNEKAISFKEQFDLYVQRVNELLKEVGGSTKEVQKALDLDSLYEYSLKIFGDVFESLIGAVFIDSECIETTWKVLWNLMKPYIGIYANLNTLQDHSRTKLLELWN